jgi:sporulation protein YlmC with PRC-barrel domain
MSGLHLVHDVQDVQLVDRTKQKVGRVDVLVLKLEDDKPLRVATILVGGSPRAQRIGPWMERWWAGWRRLRHVEAKISRIPFSAVRRIGDSIEVEVDEEALPSQYREHWLMEHIVCRLPGAEGDKK